MENYTIKASGVEYSVKVCHNPDNKGRRGAGIGEGLNSVLIEHPNQDQRVKGMFFWSKHKLFEDPSNDYQRIFNFIKENHLND